MCFYGSKLFPVTRTFGSVDLLHFIEGLFKNLTKIWTWFKFNNGKARISKEQWNEFEELLLVQKLPSVFSRKICSISNHFNYFKAMESLIFILYTSRLLTLFFWFAKYAEHHMLLVNTLNEVLTLGKNVKELALIKSKFIRWLIGYNNLYGPQVCVNYALLFLFY